MPSENDGRLDGDARQVLAQFGFTDCPAELPPLTPLGSAGGFSGARFWRLETSPTRYCLRRWPREHPSPERLGWIHAVLEHASGGDVVPLPVPLRSRAGTTWVARRGHLWELTPWLPGAAEVQERPSAQRLTAALESLAGFHLAAANFPEQPGLLLHPPSESPGRSPGLQQRAALLREWLTGGDRRLAASLNQGNWPELALRGWRLLEFLGRLGPPLLDRLERASRSTLPLQPCIRDIWRAHVLFEGNRVSGIVDFGALGREVVSGDVARLLGSLVGNDREAWRRGLAAYEARRPLRDLERPLVPLLDQSGVLLGGLNWLRWIYLENRLFDRPRVLERVDEALRRLAGNVE